MNYKRTESYYKVKDNEVVQGPLRLPRAYENISNFHKLPDHTLATYGFLPEFRQVYDPKTHHASGRTVEVLENRVQISYTLEERPTAQEIEMAWDALRAERDDLLLRTDHTQLEDAPITPELKAEFQVYRQALRDLPQNTQDPFNPDWPTPPQEV